MKTPVPAKRAKSSKINARAKTRSQPAKRRNKVQTTGLPDEETFFLGGEDRIAGVMHYKPPRWTQEYAGMAVHQLVRRIRRDIGELLARAYPTATEERLRKVTPSGTEFRLTYRKRLRQIIDHNIAESLSPGLGRRIRSPIEAERTRAVKEYLRLVDELLVAEPRNAANALAVVAKETATYLENLFIRQSAIMHDVAVNCDLWPVNLGLKWKGKTGATKASMTRQAFAREYLKELGLNSAGKFPIAQRSGAEDTISPFKLAAEALYQQMGDWKRDLPLRINRIESAWSRRLLALPVPMTTGNAPKWWAVAKVFLDERWKKARHEFEPLIQHLKLSHLSAKIPYESVIKVRVIDSALKEAFEALAQPDL